MKRFILIAALSFAFVSSASDVSYDTDIAIEKTISDCDQDLNVAYDVVCDYELTNPYYALHTAFTFVFDSPYHVYGIKSMNGVDSVPCTLYKKARDNC